MDNGNQIPVPAEMARKAVHLFALIIPVGYLFVSFPAAISWVSVSAAVSILIDIARFRQWVLWKWLSWILTPIIREHEIKGGFTGASYILVTSLCTIILFPKTIAVAAMVFIVIGDTAAALVGRLYGKHKLIGKKSIEGSTACLISVALVSFLIPDLPTLAGIIGAVAAALAEAFSGKIDDNMTVPLISGLAMLAVMRFMGYEQAALFGGFSSP
jgi:dolichol kinase